MRHAEANARPRRQPFDRVPGQANLTMPHGKKSGDGPRQRRLTGAVGTDQRHYLAGADFKIDSVQHDKIAISRFDCG
jgi:hypothetical protein